LHSSHILYLHHPPTTEIYTLSLHDALPIWDIRKKIIESLFVQGNAKALVAIAKTEKDPQLKKKAIEQLSVMNSKEGTELFEEMRSEEQRLNSSHVAISYAVFCLKKKKK